MENELPETLASVPIVKISKGERVETPDQVVKEYCLTIYLNDTELVTLLCTPQKLDYLTVGFLASEGLLEKPSDLTSLRLDQEKGIVYVKSEAVSSLASTFFEKRTITSGCGKGTIFYNVIDSLKAQKIESAMKIESAQVLELMKELHKRAELFQLTGGVHSCALASVEALQIVTEDVGRHNAIDKIFGECLMKDIPLSDKIILSSGRISSEIVLKVAKRGVPFIVSRAAPTTLAIQVAEELGITLIGFVRGSRMNIYAHTERVI